MRWLMFLLTCLLSCSPTIAGQLIPATLPSAGCGATCFRVSQLAGRTTTGTQDFTVTDFGTPDGYLLSLTYGITNGSAAAHWGLGIGAGDGTNEAAVSSSDEDALGSSDVYRTATDLASISIVDRAGALDGSAAFSSFPTDGVRLNYASNALNAAYLVNMAVIKAANVTTGTGTHTGAINTSQTFTVGHDVDVVFFFGAGQAFDESLPNLHKAIAGVAVNGSGQWSITTSAEDNQTVTDLHTRINNNRAFMNLSNSGGSIVEAGEITSYPANAFAMTKRDASGDVRFGFLAIELSPGYSAWAGVHSTPTSTGQQVVTTPGFQPQFLYGVTSYVDTVNTVRNTNAGGAGSLGVFMADATNLYAHHVASEEAAATSNTQSMSTTGELLVSDGAGTQVFDVDALTMTASGWNWFFNTSVPGTARLWGMLAISK